MNATQFRKRILHQEVSLGDRQGVREWVVGGCQKFSICARLFLISRKELKFLVLWNFSDIKSYALSIHCQICCKRANKYNTWWKWNISIQLLLVMVRRWLNLVGFCYHKPLIIDLTWLPNNCTHKGHGHGYLVDAFGQVIELVTWTSKKACLLLDC